MKKTLGVLLLISVLRTRVLLYRVLDLGVTTRSAAGANRQRMHRS